jgi:CheY-like chemotaxis protein
VDSTPGDGATFHVLIPALPMSSATAQLTSPMLLDDQASLLLPSAKPQKTGTAAHQPTGPAVPSETVTPTGGPRILVMDDEAPICELAAELLGREGYDVQTSADGEEAIRKYEAAMASGQPYEVVILDLTVRGGMGGKETVGRLRRIDPSLKAIVSSGYSQDPLVSRYRDFGFCGVVSKPYSITEMVQEIEQARMASSEL